MKTRTCSSLVGVVGLTLGLSVLLAGCSGEIPKTVEPAPDAVIESVALRVEGMT